MRIGSAAGWWPSGSGTERVHRRRRGKLGAVRRLGMNAGVASAMSLAWQVCGRRQGWADGVPGRLRGRAAADHRPGVAPGDRQGDGERRGTRRGTSAAIIEEPGAAGDAFRAKLGPGCARSTSPGSRAGLNFGYFYDRSPIIAYDGQAAPLTTWAASRRPRPRVAGCSISGSAPAARSMTRSGPTTRSCGSSQMDAARSSRPPRSAAAAEAARCRRSGRARGVPPPTADRA